MSYVLTGAADHDLYDIAMQGMRLFGPWQAFAYVDRLERSFRTLAETPAIARERPGLSPPVRVHPCGAHVIVFQVEGDGIVILRIRHGREDWADDPVG